MVSLFASDNKSRATHHFKIPRLQQRFILNVFADLSCQTLEISWKWITSLASCYKSATPLSFFQEFKMYKSTVLARLSPSTNFSDVWLTAQNSLGVGRGSLGHQQPNLAQLQKMKECGFRQLKYTTLPAHSTSRAHTSACLSVAADLSQSYMCLSLHPPHLLCWHCDFMPVYKDDVRSMHFGPGPCWGFSVSLTFWLHQTKHLTVTNWTDRLELDVYEVHWNSCNNALNIGWSTF